jgi:hypothetical protein
MAGTAPLKSSRRSLNKETAKVAATNTHVIYDPYFQIFLQFILEWDSFVAKRCIFRLCAVLTQLYGSQPDLLTGLSDDLFRILDHVRAPETRWDWFDNYALENIFVPLDEDM